MIRIVWVYAFELNWLQQTLLRSARRGADSGVFKGGGAQGAKADTRMNIINSNTFAASYSYAYA